MRWLPPSLRGEGKGGDMMLYSGVSWRRRASRFLACRMPGVLLCLAISGLASLLAWAEGSLLGKAWLEPMNLALLVGVCIRTVYEPGRLWVPGIRYCSRTLLNIAIACLGASFSIGAVLSAGPWLLAGVAGIVAFSLAFTCCVGRVAGLPVSQTLLVACGNSICGNSAIMAAAPVIHARDEDVGATIAFTAAGGLVIVLGLPLLAPVLNVSDAARGALAGLTVYAVPQVIAASSPFGLAAVHMGTLVKLMRVLMLGPVCVVLSWLSSGFDGGPRRRTRLVPWYITGFLIMMAGRSFDMIPHGIVAPLNVAATVLTILAMAALGLSIDLRSVMRAGQPLILTVALSLCGLVGASVILVRVMPGG
ncbi:putative membrane protein [Gluconacetobacter diazotrophicus PA1 5]|uniref:Putative membrane protein n=2 Tax=Gluconacetobacter diazotrophicus TaxID=33996 RepID=A9H915_GLUDA|nr:putative membrane protein [Gluconacetobacter diazotrophicus PA1 5]